MGNQNERFIENLSLLLASGMDVLSALSSLKQQARGRQKKQIDQMHQALQEGSKLWEVLKESGMFPKYALSLIRIGEESGTLADNLKVVAGQQARQRRFRSKLRSAMAYPVLVFFLTLTAGLGITWFILPRLTRIFDQLDAELPLITEILLTIGNFMAESGYWFVPIFLMIMSLLVYLLFFFPYTKFMGQWLLFRVPGIHNLVLHVEVARFSYLLSTMLKADIPIVEALESLREATALSSYKKVYEHMAKGIESGLSFNDVFTKEDWDFVLPNTVQDMIVTAEQSGSLAETLETINENYDNKIETAAKYLEAILEPVLLVIVWLLVVGVAVAIILPIYSLVGDLR